MLELITVSVVVAAIAAPHLLPLHAVAPRTASVVWLLALALRAFVGIGIAIFVGAYLPQTEVFALVARWCWHAIVPVLTTHLGVSGHALADTAVILPSLALAGSVLWVLFCLGRAGLAVHLHLRTRSRGRGPLGSTIVEDSGVLVAVTSVGRARLLVSEAALSQLDDAELAASLAHEAGHVRRRHRPLLFVGSVLAALARLCPGTATAERALAFHLERDADEYAVHATRDPLALASAICKAAAGPVAARLLALGGGGSVCERLEYLVGEGAARRTGALLERSIKVLAVAMAALVLMLSVSLPAWAMASPGHAGAISAGIPACPH